jgi:hypothetical protein
MSAIPLSISVSGCSTSTTPTNHTVRFECADPSPTAGSASGLISVVRADVNDLHCQLLAF